MKLDNKFLNLIASNLPSSEVIVGSINVDRTGGAYTLQHTKLIDSSKNLAGHFLLIGKSH